MSYFSSLWGSAPAEAESGGEEARQREVRRKKAAAEARKKREQAQADEDDDIASFTVAAKSKPGCRQAAAATPAAAGARVVGSRSAKAAPGTDALPAINEEGVARAAPAKAWSAATADPEEMKRLAARAQAAQEQAVADLMAQVKEQQQEELDAAVAAAREETKQQVQKECDAAHSEQLIARLAEAAKDAAAAQEEAVSAAVAVAVAEAEKWAAEALAATEARHAEVLAATKADAEEQMQQALEEMSTRLEKQHQATLVTSAAMVRQAESEGDQKREDDLREMRELLAKEHAADKQAAVDKAEAEANSVLAQVRIEMTTDKNDSIRAAVEETEMAVTTRLETAHRMQREKLAERQKAFNITFKKLMQELADQPDRVASPRRASPTAQEAALAIKYND